MPCKMGTKKRSKGASRKLRNLREKQLESTLPRCHEDHISEKGFNSIRHYHLVRKFIPMLQAMKIRDAKAAVAKEWDKLEKLRAWNLD